MDFRLINLDCPACGSAMNAGPHDILYVCQHCGSGAILGETELELIESTALLPTPGHRAMLWRPGWWIEADVSVQNRRDARGRVTRGWSEKRTFVIPAFALDLPDLTLLSRELSSVSGTTGEMPREPCQGGTLALEDALIFIHYLVTGAEVERPDDLATLNVEISPVSHRIVALPFDKREGRLCCSVTGTVISS